MSSFDRRNIKLAKYLNTLWPGNSINNFLTFTLGKTMSISSSFGLELIRLKSSNVVLQPEHDMVISIAGGVIDILRVSL